jgi:hypothetical protein
MLALVKLQVVVQVVVSILGELHEQVMSHYSWPVFIFL